MRLTPFRVCSKVTGDFGFPTVTIRQKLVFIVIQLFTGFGGKFKIRALDNRVYRTGFLTKAAINTFGHVDIITCGTPAAIVAWFGFDGDGLCRTNRFA